MGKFFKEDLPNFFLNKIPKFLRLIMKISLSTAVIARAVGRMAGYVFSFYKGKIQYIRRAYTETKASPKQAAWRDQYHVVDLAFKELTDEQRKAWRKYAPKNQNEYSYFMKVNLKRAAEGKEVIYWPTQVKGGWDG